MYFQAHFYFFKTVIFPFHNLMLISLETDFPIFKCGCFEIFHKMEQKKFWSDILLFLLTKVLQVLKYKVHILEYYNSWAVTIRPILLQWIYSALGRECWPNIILKMGKEARINIEMDFSSILRTHIGTRYIAKGGNKQNISTKR